MITPHEKIEQKEIKELGVLLRKEAALEKSIKAVHGKDDQSALRGLLRDIRKDIRVTQSEIESNQVLIQWQRLVSTPINDAALDVILSGRNRPFSQETLDFFKNAERIFEAIRSKADHGEDPKKMTVKVDQILSKAQQLNLNTPITPAPWYPLAEEREAAANAVWQQLIGMVENPKRYEDYKTRAFYLDGAQETIDQGYKLAKVSEALLDGSSKKIEKSLEEVDYYYEGILKKSGAKKILDKIFKINDYEKGMPARKAALDASSLQGVTRPARAPTRQTRL